MRFWKRLVWSVSDYRFAMLRLVKTNIMALETECNRLTSYIVGARPTADETKESFVVRRNRELRAAKGAVGFDIKYRVCWKLATWMEHMIRHPAQPGIDVLRCQNETWLAQRRSDLGGRGTRTRTNAGIPLRLDTGWVNFVNQIRGSYS